MKRSRLLLGLFVLLAVGLRVGAILCTHGTNAPAEENRIIARNLATGRGFTFTEFGVTGPTAIRGPTYPMLLAIVGPDRVGLILTINVVAGAATVLAAYALTGRLLSPLSSPPPEYRAGDPNAVLLNTADKTTFAPLLAAGLFAVWPTQVYAATLPQGLSIAVLLTLASLALAYRRTLSATLAAGLLAGVAALTEPVLALPLLLTAIVLGWRTIDVDNRRRWHWPEAALFVAAGCVLVAPWLYRNAVVFDRTMPITSNFWRNVFFANGPGSLGTRYVDPRFIPTSGPGAGLDRLNRPITSLDFLTPAEFDRLKKPEPERIEAFRAITLKHLGDASWLRFGPVATRFGAAILGERLEGTRHAKWNALYSVSRAIEIVALLVILTPVARLKGLLRALVLSLFVGLAIVPALSLVEPRLSVLMDIPQLLGVSLLAFAVVGARAIGPRLDTGFSR